VKGIASLVMKRRARAVFCRISPHMPSDGTIADVGSGTGHNAELIRRQTSLMVNEYDVADLHWTGPGPTLMQGASVPAPDRSHAVVLLLFVLHYPESASHLLRDARRISRGSVIVLQSTYSGALGLFVLRLREFVWGRLAFQIAVFMRLVQDGDCPLHPRRFYTRPELLDEFQRAGLIVRSIHPSSWLGLNVSRDLFILEPKAA
jgi:hypothetical protein